MLALDVDVPREGLLAPLGPQRRRLEFLDYPGEWLLDLPLLGQSFADWSEVTLRRLETLNSSETARAFLGFVRGLPLGVRATRHYMTGHRLYTELLRECATRPDWHCSRTLPDAAARRSLALTEFFPMPGTARFADLCKAMRRMPSDATDAPMFGDLDVVVLADLGRRCTRDRRVLPTHDGTCSRGRRTPGTTRGLTGGGLARQKLPPRAIDAASAATKTDQYRCAWQSAALMRRLNIARTAARSPPSLRLPRCAARKMWWKRWRVARFPLCEAASLANHAGRFYPGEVPDSVLDDLFWQHRFLALPDFEPMRLPDAGRGGIPQLGLDALIAFLLTDIL
jgi:hypothetical protein